MRWGYLAALVLAFPVPSSFAGPPALPSTSSTVGRAATFVSGWTAAQYATQLRTRQIVWDNSPGSGQGGTGSAYAPTGAISSFYSAVTRVPVNAHTHSTARIISACGVQTGGGCTLAWFQANHPTWIIYKHDQLTPAYEFSDTTWIPLDISNPDVQAWIEANYYAPILATGIYNGISVDNVSDQNTWDEEYTCSIAPVTGCTADGGTATHKYTGSVSGDATFVANRVSWLQAITTYAHANSAVSIGNIFYDPNDQTDTASLIGAVDIWYDEQGFNGDAATATCQAGGGSTYQFWGTYWTGKVAFINGLNSGAGWPMVQEAALCPLASPNRAVVQYAMASYYLTNMGHTWVAPYSVTAGDYSDQSPKAVWPELYKSLGTAVDAPPTSGDSNGIWSRKFSGGIAIVNPSSTLSEPFTLSGNYHNLDGTPYSGTITLPPVTGMTLLSGSSPGVVIAH